MRSLARFSLNNLIFLFVVGFFVGAILKNTISHHIRIGYQDPQTIITEGKLYDIDIVEQNLLKQGVPEGEPVIDSSQQK